MTSERGNKDPRARGKGTGTGTNSWKKRNRPLQKTGTLPALRGGVADHHGKGPFFERIKKRGSAKRGPSANTTFLFFKRSLAGGALAGKRSTFAKKGGARADARGDTGGKEGFEGGGRPPRKTMRSENKKASTPPENVWKGGGCAREEGGSKVKKISQQKKKKNREAASEPGKRNTEPGANPGKRA